MAIKNHPILYLKAIQNTRKNSFESQISFVINEKERWSSCITSLPSTILVFQSVSPSLFASSVQ